MKNLLITFSLTFISLPALAQEYGYLKFDLNVDSAIVVTNNDYFDLHKIADGDSIKLIAGPNLINLSDPFAKRFESFITIPVNSTKTLEHFFENELSPQSMSSNTAAYFHYDANVMILTDENSKIYFNNEYAGTAFAKLKTDTTRAKVTIENPVYGRKDLTMVIWNHQVNFLETYKRPTKGNATIFSFIPGASQIYKRQYLKGSAFALTSIVLFTLSAKSFSNYNKEYDLFKHYRLRYNWVDIKSDVLYWAEKTEKQADVVRKIDNQRRLLLSSALLLYALNILDAVKSPPKGGYQEKKSLDFYLSSDQEVASLNLRYHF